jgi:hypothetical protein
MMFRDRQYVPRRNVLSPSPSPLATLLVRCLPCHHILLRLLSSTDLPHKLRLPAGPAVCAHYPQFVHFCTDALILCILEQLQAVTDMEAELSLNSCIQGELRQSRHLSALRICKGMHPATFVPAIDSRPIVRLLPPQLLLFSRC